MEFHRSLEILGLEADATPEEIQARYKELAKERHPDRNGGPGDEMAELNLARDVALAGSQARGLVPVETVLSLIQRDQSVGVEQRRAGERAKQATDDVVQVGIGRLAQLQHLMLGVGLVLGGLAVLFRLAPQGSLWFDDDATFIALGAIAVFAGFYMWMLRGIIKRIELGIRTLADSLSDTSTYAEVLDGLLRHHGLRRTAATLDDQVRFGRPDLMAAWEHWMEDARRRGRPLGLIFSPPRTVQDLAGIAGRHDFVTLLIARGIENGLLRERRIREDGRLKVDFQLQA